MFLRSEAGTTREKKKREKKAKENKKKKNRKEKQRLMPMEKQKANKRARKMMSL